ncbi:hypothetical protein ABTL50_19670, partial [Acinetobacter baumannii]
ELFKTKFRYAGTQWGDSSIALVREISRTKQLGRLSRYNTSTNTLELLFERSSNDAYNNHGNPVSAKNKYNRDVIVTIEKGTKLLM